MRSARLTALLGGQGDWMLSDPAWEQVLGQARRSNLAARLARTVGRRQVVVPERIGLHLAAADKVQRRAAQAMRVEAMRLVGLLHQAGIPVVLLKGAAYLMADLPPAQGRLFGDIDLLVARADLARAESALLGGGWIASDLGRYNQRYYREWMHEIPPLVHVSRGSIVDLHHTIAPPTSVFRVDGAALLGASRSVAAAPGCAVLQPTDMVLHSAVHLFTDGEFEQGLRDMLDLHDLLHHFGHSEPAFWPALLDRAAQLGVQRPLYHALHHVERLFGPVLPDPLRRRANELRPPTLPRLLMAWLLAVALRPPHPSCRQPGDGLARWLLYVRSHWLRMPVYLLLPHLLRKAWMRRFPDRASKQQAAGPVA